MKPPDSAFFSKKKGREQILIDLAHVIIILNRESSFSVAELRKTGRLRRKKFRRKARAEAAGRLRGFVGVVYEYQRFHA